MRRHAPSPPPAPVRAPTPRPPPPVPPRAPRQATLGTGNLHDAVTLPPGEDVNEWLAVNTVDFFNELSLLYGVVAEFCTEANCPVMCAGPKYEYMWADGQAVKKPISVSAPRYVDFLMTWVQNQLDDEKLFPTQIGVPFPADFVDSVRNIFRRLFRIYVRGVT